MNNRKGIFVSLIPIFRCNRKCKYCYQKDKVDDCTLIAVEDVYKRLEQIGQQYDIDTISIFGGEVSLLDRQYIDQLFELCKSYCLDTNINTNLTNTSIIDIAHKHSVGVGVSYNVDRDDYKFVRKMLRKLPNNVVKTISVDTVITPPYVTCDAEKLLDEYQSLGIKAVLFLPYSPSVTNHVYRTFNRQYENTLIRIYEQYQKRKYDFEITNFDISIKRQCGIEGNIFILPNGNFATVAYDENQHEYFHQFTILKHLKTLQLKEYEHFPQCMNCPYYNSYCLAEHLKVWDNDHDVCCGCKQLIERILSDNNGSVV